MSLTASTKHAATAAFRHVIPAGEPYLFEVRAGQTLRRLDLEGNQAVDTLFYSARNPRERYDPQRTLRKQNGAYLTTGTVLWSNLGNPLLTIVADTCGWHDSFGGVLNAEEVTEKYGAGRYQELRNGYFRNGVDNLLVEMGKWNLNLQDLLMALNLFSKVSVDGDGRFHFEPGNSKAGDYIELYAPMDCLVVLTALQHPLDPNPQYAPKPVQLSWSKVESDGISVLCRTSRPENGRGFHNTERLYI